jgi:hypothetical protein
VSRLAPVAACLAVLAVVPSSLAQPRAAAGARIAVYPSSVSVRPTGALPSGGARAAALNVAVGEREDAVVVVAGGRQVALSAPASIGPLPLRLFFAHYVSFGARVVPDALLPWGGEPRSAEKPNQPLWLQVTVPYGTAPGLYSGSVGVVVDGQTTTVPISVRVFPVSLPAPNQVAGALLTSFHLSAQTYGTMVGRLNGYRLSAQFAGISPTLYSFLASYRISPASWGFGEPSSPAGYTHNKKWWLSSADNMVAQVQGGAFAAMRLPISNNRTAPHNYIAGLSPARPDTWCSYLQSVRSFWADHGWTGSYAYLYGQDEPGPAGMRLVGRQASVLHRCFPGGKDIVTGNPAGSNAFLWDGKGNDDVDAWVVLGSRYYGQYTVPKLTREGRSREREAERLIDAVRARGKMIWTFNYPGTKTPGFDATEPLSDSRMLFLWSALENVRGVLYGDGTTSYKGNPFESVADGGAHVLVYPGVASPVPSARLEQIRDGIEDWEIYDVVRRKHGGAAVRQILGAAGLFSASRKGVELGCTVGCKLKTATPFSWPVYSHDASTPRRIEKAKLAALLAAS